MSRKYDLLDLQILNELKKDCKRSVKQISKTIGSHPNTVLQRIKKLKDSRTILKYVGIVDFRKLGYDTHAIVLIKVKKGELQNRESLQKIAKIPNVETFYAITGGIDCVAIIRAKDRDEMVKVLEKIQSHPMVLRTTTHIILHTYKNSYEFNPLEEITE
ncbi:Lrp/AsnC family transcriptional regulator [Candidatus Micrarchaeota archaeon]|nr:Lrp/AsnC family transcriptional regulator [Candidatus Micrarchaeota archaeon]